MPTVSILNRDKDDKITQENAEVFEIESTESIYEEIAQKGKSMPHGCLSGSCGVCRIEIVEGAENLDAISEIEQDTIESISQSYKKNFGHDSMDGKTVRMACRCRVLKGDVKIIPMK